MSRISANILVRYWKAKECVKDFFQEERGDSTIIAVILVLVVVVGLALIFKDNIVALVNSLWEKINASTEGFGPETISGTGD